MAPGTGVVKFVPAVKRIGGTEAVPAAIVNSAEGVMLPIETWPLLATASALDGVRVNVPSPLSTLVPLPTIKSGVPPPVLVVQSLLYRPMATSVAL